MTAGLALSVVMDKRTLDYEQFKIQEERARRICFYGSMWLDHKGKSASDLYPLPWETKNAKENLDKDVAELTIMDFQEAITKSGGDVKAASAERGFEKLFGKQ